MDLGLAGSKAVVTGGSKGMGLAIAQTLAAEGASVAVMAREKAALGTAVESLRAAGAPEVIGISVDMSDASPSPPASRKCRSVGDSSIAWYTPSARETAISRR